MNFDQIIDIFYKFFENEAIIIPLLAWFVAQTIKVILVSIHKKKFSFSLYLIPGGFPSSHTAAIAALATVIALECGVDSPIFASVLALTIFVIYDASVLRRASQRQAKSLNKLVDAIQLGKEIEPLKEVLGHSWFEVFMGGVLGIATALFIML